MATPADFAHYPSLRDRVILISGGASGIGAAVVEAFAAQQAQVAFLDIDHQAAARLIHKLAANQDAKPPTFYPCDLTHIPTLQTTVASIAQHFGKIDVLVNNAGNDARHLLEDVTSDSWDRSIAVNLKHQFFMTQAVLPAMRRAGGGSIINLSSIAPLIPSVHLPVYITAKAGIVGLTRTLAHELGPHNIRVNAVLPGAIATERQKQLWYTPEYQAEILAAQALKRLILPEEVARLVLFLAADDSSAITNQSYVIDGGWV